MEAMKKENNELNINLSDDINYNDELLRNTINNMQISKSSIKNYTYEMTKFLKCIGISFNDLIATISKQQHHKIENNLIIEYDPQNSLLKNYYDKYINECRTKGNKETTIQTRIRTINTILSYCNIKTPKIKFNIVNSFRFLTMTILYRGPICEHHIGKITVVCFIQRI